MLTSKISNRHR